MKNATMCMVGLLMIVMLVGFGASAAAPAEPVDDWDRETRSVEETKKDEIPNRCTPILDPERQDVDSYGGLYYDCTGPGCPPSPHDTVELNVY